MKWLPGVKIVSTIARRKSWSMDPIGFLFEYLQLWLIVNIDSPYANLRYRRRNL